MIAKYKDEAQAVADLKKLRGTANIQADIDAIREQTSGSRFESLSIPQVRTHILGQSSNQSINIFFLGT